jgi:hypothetical protein
MRFFWLLSCTVGDDTNGDTNGGEACTEMGCIDGLTVQFDPPLEGKGTYAFDVTVDGAAYHCEATIPLEGSSTVCGSGGIVSIFLSGSELPVAEQTLPGLHVEGTPASVQVQVHRDDALVADADLSPKYQTVQPNGPDCEPTCHSASVDAPTK